MLYWEELENTLAKEQDTLQKKQKKQYKSYFENEKGVFMNERIARDVIERYKLPEAIELRKN